MSPFGRASRAIASLVTLSLCVSAWAAVDLPPGLSQEARAALQRIASRDPLERQTGFLQLEALRQPNTVPVIRQYLASRQPQLRAYSARALAAVERVRAIPTLIGLLERDRHVAVRMAAVLAMEPFDDPRVLPALMDALDDRHPHVRMAAVDAVSRVPHGRAHEAVALRWKRERHRDVRRVLEAAMTRIGAE